VKRFITQFFTWWNEETLGTRFFTWRKGVFVGEDEFGNRYYRERKGAKRWVIYSGPIEPSAIPPGWYGWIRHMTDELPGPYKAREWERPYQPNATGTPLAYHPRGSLVAGEQRPRVSDDYDAWKP